MIIDAHAHLTESPMIDDIQRTLDDFVHVGGGAIVTQSSNDETFESNVDIVHYTEDINHDCLVKTTRGWHPREVVQGNITESMLESMELKGAEMIERHEDSIVAVGECGIDLHYDGAAETLSLQQSVLAAHCRLALGFGLPVVVHSRDAFSETMDVLVDFPEVTIYVHCRGYDEAALEKFLTYCPRSFVGFCGNITYPSAENLRTSLASLPLDRLLLETDAPYLTPQLRRGQKNTPALIYHTYDYVANLIGIDRDALDKQVVDNFFRMYQLM